MILFVKKLQISIKYNYILKNLHFWESSTVCIILMLHILYIAFSLSYVLSKDRQSFLKTLLVFWALEFCFMSHRLQIQESFLIQARSYIYTDTICLFMPQVQRMYRHNNIRVPQVNMLQIIHGTGSKSTLARDTAISL